MCTRQAGPTSQALTNQVSMVKLLGNVMSNMEQLCIDLILHSMRSSDPTKV